MPEPVHPRVDAAPLHATVIDEPRDLLVRASAEFVLETHTHAACAG